MTRPKPTRLRAFLRPTEVRKPLVRECQNLPPRYGRLELADRLIVPPALLARNDAPVAGGDRGVGQHRLVRKRDDPLAACGDNELPQQGGMTRSCGARRHRRGPSLRRRARALRTAETGNTASAVAPFLGDARKAINAARLGRQPAAEIRFRCRCSISRRAGGRVFRPRPIASGWHISPALYALCSRGCPRERRSVRAYNLIG